MYGRRPALEFGQADAFSLARLAKAHGQGRAAVSDGLQTADLLRNVQIPRLLSVATDYVEGGYQQDLLR